MKKHFYTHFGKHFAKIAFVSMVGLISVSCSDDIRTDGFSTNDIPELLPLSNVQKEILAYLPKDCIIAHRGTEFWAPEESEAAMRWARNMGADYLECDVQRTKDGVVLALHDESLLRTTDVEVIYPNRKNDYVSAFTYEELLKLDIGSWFKDANPEQWRESFRGLEIITVQDVIKIAEGYRFKRWGQDTNGVLDGHRYGERIYDRIELPDGKVKYDFKYVEDEADNGNRQGIYVETKSPVLFSGVEQDLHDIFVEYGWYHDDINQLKRVPYKNNTPGLVDIANTPARIILQTFSDPSLKSFNTVFKRTIPYAYLYADLESTPATYARLINFAIENGATIMAPNIDYVTGYPSSLKIWQGEMIRRAGMDIHAWSFNTNEQYLAYTGPWSDPKGEGGADKNYLDMSFTNLTDLCIRYYNDTMQKYKDAGKNYFRDQTRNRHAGKGTKTAQQVLDELGY